MSGDNGDVVRTGAGYGAALRLGDLARVTDK